MAHTAKILLTGNGWLAPTAGRRWTEGSITEFENKELAEFLEETVHALVDLDPDSIAVVARNENSQTVFTTSFNCNAEYKAILAFHFLSDIVTDIVRINRDYIFNDDDDEMGDDDIE